MVRLYHQDQLIFIKKIGNERKADAFITASRYSMVILKKAGFQQQIQMEVKCFTSFTSSRDESNVGVTFALSATYNGRIVDVNVIAADAEEVDVLKLFNLRQMETKWEQFMALNLQKTLMKTAQGAYPSRQSDVNADGSSCRSRV